MIKDSLICERKVLETLEGAEVGVNPWPYGPQGIHFCNIEMNE
jgi:hypothetical protein